MEHKYSTVALLVLGSVIFVSSIIIALESSDIDDLCATNNQILKRVNGTWVCSDIFTLNTNGSYNSASINMSTNATIIFNYDDDGVLHDKENDQAIELRAMNPQAKPFIAWLGYYMNGSTLQRTYTGWLGCHYNTSINPTVHSHCAWETLGSDDGMASRFYITYGSTAANLYAKFNQIGYVELGRNVDLFMNNDSSDIRHSTNLDIFPQNQVTYAFRVGLTSNVPTISSVGSNNLLIADNLRVTGNSNITGDSYIGGIKSDGTGKVVCIKSDGGLGTCSTTVDASGVCTCG